MKPAIRGGYPEVRVTDAKGRSVHSLVLEAFVGPRPEGLECRHLNGNPLDSRLENLRWGTKSENYADRHGHGTANDGERHGNAAISNSVAIGIFQAEGTDPEIAKRFGVTSTQVNKIKHGHGWRGITGAKEVFPGVAFGERGGRAKLTDGEVLAIRASSLSTSELARMHGMSHTAVAFARSGKTWKHLPV